MSSVSNNPVGLSVVIPHLQGEQVLKACLDSLRADALDEMQVIVVDNGCNDGSVQAVFEAHPWISVIRSEENLGFAGGCNLGISISEHPHILILNDDAEVVQGCLKTLVDYASTHPSYGALQPKVRSSTRVGEFDYAGAAGGFVDRFGFPFARGRIFETIEEDHGQYDDDCDILWASGACCLLRREAIESVGLFDGSFFAHMEEIDLCWRLWLAGWKVGFVADALVVHRGSATLVSGAPTKVYLNHRNSLWLMVKNLGLGSLFACFPIRILLDWLAVGYYLGRLRPSAALAVFRAQIAAVAGLPRVFLWRRHVQSGRLVTDQQLDHLIWRRSIVLQRLVFGRRSFSEMASGSRQGGDRS